VMELLMNQTGCGARAGAADRSSGLWRSQRRIAECGEERRRRRRKHRIAPSKEQGRSGFIGQCRKMMTVTASVLVRIVLARSIIVARAVIGARDLTGNRRLDANGPFRRVRDRTDAKRQHGEYAQEEGEKAEHSIAPYLKRRGLSRGRKKIRSKNRLLQSNISKMGI